MDAAILAFVRDNPGCTRRQIKTALGIDLFRVQKRTKALVLDGLLVVTEGRSPYGSGRKQQEFHLGEVVQ